MQIESLGARGDGIGHLDGRRVYVPLVAPGDRVRVRPGAPRGDGLAAELVEVIEPSPLRSAPGCAHFGDCGGCAAQHLAAEPYAAWKRDLVLEALAHRGIRDAGVLPPVQVAPGTRRRITLAVVGVGGAARLGFSARASHRVVNLHECKVAAPAIVDLLPPLRAALGGVLCDGERAEIMVTMTQSGPDLLLVCEREPDRGAREVLAAFAEEWDMARLSWAPSGGPAEPLAWRRPAIVAFAGVDVEPPPGAFLQPSAEGEAALVRAVGDALSGHTRIADLFAGCGTFTFPLAASGASVHAVEGVAVCVDAVTTAAGRAGLGGRVTARARDLEEQPLTPEELLRFSAVLFDPPRAGARAQAEMLARSSLATVVAVSCSPATFARDARILIDAGFHLGPVTPVDQFLWSPHIELVAAFKR